MGEMNRKHVYSKCRSLKIFPHLDYPNFHEIQTAFLVYKAFSLWLLRLARSLYCNFCLYHYLLCCVLQALRVWLKFRLKCRFVVVFLFLFSLSVVMIYTLPPFPSEQSRLNVRGPAITILAGWLRRSLWDIIFQRLHINTAKPGRILKLKILLNIFWWSTITNYHFTLEKQRQLKSLQKVKQTKRNDICRT